MIPADLQRFLYWGVWLCFSEWRLTQNDGKIQYCMAPAILLFGISLLQLKVRVLFDCFYPLICPWWQQLCSCLYVGFLQWVVKVIWIWLPLCPFSSCPVCEPKKPRPRPSKPYWFVTFSVLAPVCLRTLLHTHGIDWTIESAKLSDLRWFWSRTLYFTSDFTWWPGRWPIGGLFLPKIYTDFV